MTRVLVGLFLAGLITIPVHAQDSGLAFLSIGVDAEALSVGDQGVASARGAFATYWNPAGMVAGGNQSLGISHHRWIADVRTYAASGVIRRGSRSAFGAFITATDSGDLEARQAPGASDGAFTAQFVSAGASFARSFGNVRVGATGKFISERIFAQSANGFAVDAGMQWDLLGDGLHVGAALSNVGRMSDLNAEATKLPRLIRVGGAFYPFRVLADLDGAVLLSTGLLVEVSHNTAAERTQMHIGLTGNVLETVSVRAGYLSNDELRDFSAGLGVTQGTLALDYAVLPFSDGFGGPAHILTVAYGF
jgi:hypothetical protein